MDNIIYSIENFAGNWLEFILSSSLQTGIFLFLITVLTFIFRKQPAKFLYVLWLIGLLKIIIPPTITIPTFLGTESLPIDPNIFIISIPDISFAATAPKTPELSFKGYLLLFWITGVVLISGVWIYNNIRFSWKIKRNSCTIENPQIASIVKYKNPKIKFYSTPDVTIPFTRGIFKPKIFLPSQALNWSKNELRAVVLHEYAHIKRKDVVVIALQNIIQILFFFHPLVWMANIQIARYREKACDDFAINGMKGNSIDYSKFLLKSIDNAFTWKPIPTMNTYFTQSKKSLLNRFEYILNRKEEAMNKFSRFQKLVFVVLIIFGLVISCHKEQLKTTIPAQGKQETVKGDIPQSQSTAAQNTDHAVQSETTGQQKAEQKIAANEKNVKSKAEPNFESSIPSARSNEVLFVPFDDPPNPIGGFAAIQKNLRYPELARKAGIEGTVVVYTQISTKGKVEQTKIVKSLGENNGCDEAAIVALKATKWEPAKQRGKPVAVWVSVPVKFKLNAAEGEKKTEEIHPIEEISIDFEKVPPPLSDESDGQIFVPYDDAPEPIGGFAAIQKNLKYPELARKAGIEGTVVVYARIDTEGVVAGTKIVKSLGENNGCDEAAIEALKSIKWEPAKQRGKKVAVWVSVPVKFRLNDEEKEIKKQDKKSINSEKIPPSFPSIKNEDEEITFVPYDKPPYPVGGFKAIQKKVYYPSLAHRAGIEGTVILYAQIGFDGKVKRTKVVKPLGNTGCNESAIQAVKSVKWKPALQNNKPVTVWVSVPVKFKMK